MKHLSLTLLSLLLLSCSQPNLNSGSDTGTDSADSVLLADMITVREKAMIGKDIDAVMSQFSDDATWINSQGYCFEGKRNVLEFHSMLFGNETLDYSYEAGVPRIRLLDSSNAIVYYSWKMFWFKKGVPADIEKEEIGLMSLTAQKHRGQWKWVAVTNQHTPWFYDAIEAVTIDEE